MSGEKFNEQEQWMPIHNFPGYYMSRDGKIAVDVCIEGGERVLRVFRQLDKYFYPVPYWKN